MNEDGWERIITSNQIVIENIRRDLLLIRGRLLLLKKVTEENTMALEKPTFRNEVNLKVENVVLELVGKNKEFVKRYRIVTTNEGEITHRPKKPIEESGKYGHFKMEHKKTELYGTDEFIKLFPVLDKLAEMCEKEPQEIQAGFHEAFSVPDEDEEKVLYKFFREWHIKELYYKVFHGKDTENLDKQKKRSALA